MSTPNWIPASAVKEPGHYWCRSHPESCYAFIVQVERYSIGLRVLEFGEEGSSRMGHFGDTYQFQPVAPLTP